jgi:hypothetical protein
MITDMEITYSIESEAVKITNLVHMLVEEDKNLSRSTLGTSLHFIYNDLFWLRGALEELVIERAEKI